MWQINRITEETLLNISKYSNKVVKISRFLQESNQPLILQDLLSVSDQTDQIELFNAFDKDLTKTVNDIYEIQKLLITVNEDGYVKELNNEEKNLNNLFGNNYNNQTQELSFPTININLKNPVSKEQIKESIINNVFSFNSNRYKELMKMKDNIKDIDKNNLDNDNDKMNFLASKAEIDFILENVNKVNSYINSFVEIRKDLNLEEKELVDRKIMSGRTMVDGVLPNSTYISKREGVYKISSNHKKYHENHQELIEEVSNLLKESKYVSAVEIDQDTDLEKFVHLLKNIKGFYLNIDKEFELKTRKLGNYRANGLYYHSYGLIEQMGYNSEIYNVVGLDVNSPSTLVSEVTSLVDISNKDFSHSPERNVLIKYFKEKMNLPENISSMMSSEYRDYIRNPKKIISRLGEIGYILNKYNYKGHSTTEELETFFNKVKLTQSFETMGDKEIPVIHNIDFYRENKHMYFDLNNMNINELLAIKSYYQGYYNVLREEFIPLNQTTVLNTLNKNNKIVESVDLEKEEREQSKNRRFSKEDFPISKVNYHNVEDILKYNEEDNIFSNKEMAQYLSKNYFNIDRSKFSSDQSFYARAVKVVEKVFDYSLAKGNIDFQKELLNAFIFKTLRQEEQRVIKAFVSEEPVIVSRLSNHQVTDSFKPVLRTMFKNLINKNLQNKNPLTESSELEVNVKISPELVVDQELLAKQVINRLRMLKDFKKDDAFLQNSIIELSKIFNSYSEVFIAQANFDRIAEYKSSDIGMTKESLEQFSETIEAQILSDYNGRYEEKVRSNVSDLEYGERYGRNPRLSLKLEMFNQDLLLKNADEIIKNVTEVPKALAKSKVFQEGATDKQKLSFITKLPLKSIDLEFVSNFLKDTKISDIKKECQEDLMKEKRRGYNHSSYKKTRIISNFLAHNECVNEEHELSKKVLERYMDKLSLSILSEEDKDISVLFVDTFNSTLAESLTSAKKIVEMYKEGKNPETLKYLKELNSKVVDFLLNKDLLPQYVESYNATPRRNYNPSRDTERKVIENIICMTGNKIDENLVENLVQKDVKVKNKRKF
jgi:hypothetical protein